MKFLNKNTKEKYDYDVAFILPAPLMKYPPGGYDIVFRLANSLNVEDIRATVIFSSTVIFTIKKSLMNRTLFEHMVF